MISVQNVTKIFETKGGRVEALRNVSLEVAEGEICGVVGASGAGKSTLLRCMALLDQPTQGKVSLDGVCCGGLSRAQTLALRRQIGVVFQGYGLLAQRTAAQNVALPLELAKTPKKQALARAEQLLEAVGLADKAQAYPSQLSGGQRQRVAIARALAANPKALLCDEPTSALDPLSAQSVLELLERLNRQFGVTIVIITHEMRVIESICNRVAIIDEHRIAECGPGEEIFSRPQSEAARRLVLPEGRTVQMTGGRCVRIVFNGSSSFEPVVANLVLECRAPVNIL